MSSVDWSHSQRYDLPPPLHSKTSQSSFATIPENGPLPQSTITPTPTSALTTNTDAAWSLRPQRPVLLTRLSSSSRKRSREDDDDFDSSGPSTARFTPSPPKPFATLESGFGGAYPLNPASSVYSFDPSELSAQLSAMRPNLGERRDSRKSMRMDRSSPPPTTGEIIETLRAEAYNEAKAQAQLDRMAVVSMETPIAIDVATETLGIGWTTPSSAPAMAAAVRGWARYIEKNFPLQAVSIVWHNASMPAYLVSATTRPAWAWSLGSYRTGNPGYYLFDEELTQCRLVAKSWERALDALREGQRVGELPWEGDEVIRVSDGGSQEQEQGMEQAEPYYMAGMRMMEEEVTMQGRSGAWDGGTAGSGARWQTHTGSQVASAEQCEGDGMDMDMT